MIVTPNLNRWSDGYKIWPMADEVYIRNQKKKTKLFYVRQFKSVQQEVNNHQIYIKIDWVYIYSLI